MKPGDGSKRQRVWIYFNVVRCSNACTVLFISTALQTHRAVSDGRNGQTLSFVS